MAQSVEDICNQALRAAGSRKRIGSIYDGSPEARACLDFYGQVRDEVLQEQDWPFAMREAALTSASPAPPWPWIAEYIYPSDALRIHYVQPSQSQVPDPFDPQAVQFQDFNDPRIPGLALLCSLPATPSPPIAIYVGRVTNPSQWLPEFTNTFIARLGAKIALSLSQNIDVSKQAWAISDITEQNAASVNDTTPPRLPMTTGMENQRSR
ncbi:MAG TPA: hypothetical protein VKS24_25040 [Bradyrhizobium sp.]|nr:hypothetical protein [Bradyrhizobium sp.]